MAKGSKQGLKGHVFDVQVFDCIYEAVNEISIHCDYVSSRKTVANLIRTVKG